MDSWPNKAGFDTDYEEHEPVELLVKGTIPPYVAGVLYRTGPLGYKVKTDQNKIWAANHWFDGLSCVHRFEISFPDGSSTARVSYNSRRTVDELLERVRSTGKLEGLTFARKRDPCESFFHKVMGVFKPAQGPQNVGVTVSINMPGTRATRDNGLPVARGHLSGIETLHIRTDASIINAVDPETLQPRGICRQTKLHPELVGPLSAAHAQTDPKTGDVFNYNLEMGRKSTYRIFCTSASTGKTKILASFQEKPAYIHSLFLTEHYVILCVWNSQFSWSGVSILYHKNLLDAIAPFESSSRAKWYVVGRAGEGLVATYKSDLPLFCFHTINAWEQPSPGDEQGTDVICELSLYENLDVLHNLYYDNLVGVASKGKTPPSCLPHHAQFRLPKVAPRTHTVLAELVFKADSIVSAELPTINPAYSTHKHRYTYGTVNRLKSSFMDGIVKFDNTAQKAIFWETKAHTPGEAIFVADPTGTEEDDGVLLSVVLDGIAEKSYMLVLRAKDLTELGRAQMAGPMSFGFHGTYKATVKEGATGV